MLVKKKKIGQKEKNWSNIKILAKNKHFGQK